MRSEESNSIGRNSYRPNPICCGAVDPIRQSVPVPGGFTCYAGHHQRAPGDTSSVARPLDLPLQHFHPPHCGPRGTFPEKAVLTRRGLKFALCDGYHNDGYRERLTSDLGCFATFGGFLPMSEKLNVELNDRQRELLLRGLRFVRSSRMLEFRDSSDITDDERKVELSEIRQLVEMLDVKSRRSEPAAV